MKTDECDAYLSDLLSVPGMADFAPNGLQVEGKDTLQTIVTGVTASQALLDAAVTHQADAVMVHHGFFFKGEPDVIVGIKRQRIATLLQHNINLFAYHLPLDMHPIYGNNIQLADVLGIQVDGPIDESDPSVPGNIGRLPRPMTGGELSAWIAQCLHREPLHIGESGDTIETVTMGIISAKGRNRLGLNTFEDYIQTDAAINPGNSGGALINAYGELLGINTAIFTQSGGSEGIGFAIPADIAHRTMADIARYGTIIRGWLGIEVQEASPELLKSLKLPDELTGLLVTGVFPEGPAEQAGLAAGDIIIGLNGDSADNAVDAMNRIASLRPGDKITVEFLRRGEQLTTTAYAGLRDQPES